MRRRRRLLRFGGERYSRRRAIGTRSILSATEFARRSGRRSVLDVMVKDRAAIRLYERLGWEYIDSTTHVFDGSEGVSALRHVSPSARPSWTR